jgi:hypothetical protein
MKRETNYVNFVFACQQRWNTFPDILPWILLQALNKFFENVLQVGELIKLFLMVTIIVDAEIVGFHGTGQLKMLLDEGTFLSGAAAIETHFLTLWICAGYSSSLRL